MDLNHFLSHTTPQARTLPMTSTSGMQDKGANLLDHVRPRMRDLLRRQTLYLNISTSLAGSDETTSFYKRTNKERMTGGLRTTSLTSFIFTVNLPGKISKKMKTQLMMKKLLNKLAL
jgi:hypothetical protein